MKLLPSFCGICLIFLASCVSPATVPIPSNQTNPTTSSPEITLDETWKIATGQTIYVPIYSEIYYFDKSRTFQLAATLSIRNTDPKNQVIITSVNYYNSQGKIVRKHLDKPLRLQPLASTDFVVSENDQIGGSGANFMVEWIAETKVYEPIVEAIMVGTASQQGISFVSVGRVIETQSASLTSSPE